MKKLLATITCLICLTATASDNFAFNLGSLGAFGWGGGRHADSFMFDFGGLVNLLLGGYPAYAPQPYVEPVYYPQPVVYTIPVYYTPPVYYSQPVYYPAPIIYPWFRPFFWDGGYRHHGYYDGGHGGRVYENHATQVQVQQAPVVRAQPIQSIEPTVYNPRVVRAQPVEQPIRTIGQPRIVRAQPVQQKQPISTQPSMTINPPRINPSMQPRIVRPQPVPRQQVQPRVTIPVQPVRTIGLPTIVPSTPIQATPIQPINSTRTRR